MAGISDGKFECVEGWPMAWTDCLEWRNEEKYLRRFADCVRGGWRMAAHSERCCIRTGAGRRGYERLGNCDSWWSGRERVGADGCRHGRGLSRFAGQGAC